MLLVTTSTFCICACVVGHGEVEVRPQHRAAARLADDAQGAAHPSRRQSGRARRGLRARRYEYSCVTSTRPIFTIHEYDYLC